MSSPLRVAIAALKRPHVSKRLWYHQPAVSTRAIASAVANSSVGDVTYRRVFVHSHSSHDKCTHWRPLYNWTTQSMMSTSTTEPRQHDANMSLREVLKTTMKTGDDEKGDGEDEVNKVIPLQRSKKEKSKKANGVVFDDRAEAKLTALTNAKKDAEDAKAAFLASTNSGIVDSDSAELHDKWKQSEINLALAYSQAIKYTSRIMNNEDATKAAERLLSEWMDRFMDSFDSSSKRVSKGGGGGPKAKTESSNMNKKKMIKTINQIIPILTSSESSSKSKHAETTSSLQDGDDGSSTMPKIRVPPPTSKDYTNVLRAYSLSKARRKGLQCEDLMSNMVKLAKAVAFHYNQDSEEWTRDKVHDIGMESIVSGEGNVAKKWRLWVNESIPNSKHFALAIKCHAGSTRNESLEHIFLLNDVHDSFSKTCQSHIPRLYKNDPYVLFHSIKALKNLQKKEEWTKGHAWLRKLHSFVTSTDNIDYFKEMGTASVLETTKDESEESDQTDTSASSEAPDISFQTIDVTSAYTTMIRLMAKLRGADGVAAEARKVLNLMQKVHNISVYGLSKSNAPSADEHDGSHNDEEGGALMKERGRIASVDIRSNAYNLVIGLYRDSKKPEDAHKAIELLQRMVEASNEAPENRRGVPLPTEQSFEFTIMSLADLDDGEKAIVEAEKVIQLMQDQDHLESLVSAYNAFMTVCNKQLFGKAHLFDKALGILDKMNEISKANPGAVPNPQTLALVMKACSLSDHDDHEKVLGTVTKLFAQLKEQETSERTALALTDRAYFYMMKCVDGHMIVDDAAKKEKIEELFSEACQRGLCSADVLALFRDSVSDEDYALTVGKGRLADHWIANITGRRALYTDGSKGGAGKNARRKGKSTSDWEKKNKVKEAQKGRKREEKRVKKFFKSGKSGPKKKMSA